MGNKTNYALTIASNEKIYYPLEIDEERWISWEWISRATGYPSYKDYRIWEWDEIKQLNKSIFWTRFNRIYDNQTIYDHIDPSWYENWLYSGNPNDTQYMMDEYVKANPNPYRPPVYVPHPIEPVMITPVPHRQVDEIITLPTTTTTTTEGPFTIVYKDESMTAEQKIPLQEGLDATQAELDSFKGPLVLESSPTTPTTPSQSIIPIPSPVTPTSNDPMTDSQICGNFKSSGDGHRGLPSFEKWINNKILEYVSFGYELRDTTYFYANKQSSPANYKKFLANYLDWEPSQIIAYCWVFNAVKTDLGDVCYEINYLPDYLRSLDASVRRFSISDFKILKATRLNKLNNNRAWLKSEGFDDNSKIYYEDNDIVIESIEDFIKRPPKVRNIFHIDTPKIKEILKSTNLPKNPCESKMKEYYSKIKSDEINLSYLDYLFDAWDGDSIYQINMSDISDDNEFWNILHFLKENKDDQKKFQIFVINKIFYLFI